MKKLVFLSALFIQTLGFGQILNGNFEDVKPNLLANNWGINFSVPVSINVETGESTTDNIWFGSCIPSLCNSTTEASEGNFGLEISNAFNESQNTVIRGGAQLFWDSTQDSPGWNPGVPLVGNESIDWYNFMYKFIAIGTEIAEAKLIILNENGVEMASGISDLVATDDAFHFISIPVTYTETGIPTHMYVEFTMAKEGTEPQYGSRLVIDDLRTGSLLQTTTFDNQAFTISPTLVKQEMNVNWATNLLTDNTYQIINQSGQICQSGLLNANQQNTLEVADLATGVYLIKIGNTTRKFVKVE